MTDDAEPLPYLTADLSGLGGELKQSMEDFLVEELPLYEPVGDGDHLYLRIEKRDTSAEQLKQHLARQLGISTYDVGMAGLKDRFAITRQLISVPVSCETNLPKLETERIRVLEVSRHTNKLKTGHLAGNRFDLRVRNAVNTDPQRITPIVERITRLGFPNYFGQQRFGSAGDTAQLGWELLSGTKVPEDLPRSRRKFLVRFALSAVQSELFNDVLSNRLHDGTTHQVSLGDVMQVMVSKGPFVVDDVSREQPRFETRETMITGPLFGSKMKKPAAAVFEREWDVLRHRELTFDQFRPFKKQIPGARRALLVYPQEFEWEVESDAVRFRFVLPPGSYATTLMREFLKSE